jgi:hypothetical protein
MIMAATTTGMTTEAPTAQQGLQLVTPAQLALRQELLSAQAVVIMVMMAATVATTVAKVAAANTNRRSTIQIAA